MNDVAPYLGIWAGVKAAALLVGPAGLELGDLVLEVAILDVLAVGALLFAVTALIGSIANNTQRLGLKLPIPGLGAG